MQIFNPQIAKEIGIVSCIFVKIVAYFKVSILPRARCRNFFESLIKIVIKTIK